MHVFPLIFVAFLATKNVWAKDAPFNRQEQEAFYQTMQTTLTKMKTVKLNLKQVRVLKVFLDQLEASGVFYFSIPGKLRWEITRPYRSLIVYNNNQAAKFKHENGGWRKLEFGGADLMSEIMSNILDWNRGNFKASEETYDVKVFPRYLVRLTPKSEKLQKSLTNIEISIQDKTFIVKKVKLNEAKGDYVEMSFSNLRQNIDLPKGLFDLDKPSS